MDKEEVIDKYRKIVSKNSVNARKLIKQLDYKGDDYLLQCIAQTYLDESRFDDNGSPRLYIDKRKWRMAERYIIKAFIKNSKNGEVLYTMGSVRRSNNQFDIAIYCFEEIIRLGVRKIDSDYYSRGTEFAKELINDSKFELYRLYYETNSPLSKRYLSMYKTGLKKGIRTIYKPLKKYLLD